LAAVLRQHFNTLAPAAVPYEWTLRGETEQLPTGVRLKKAQPTLTSRFEIGDGTRIVFTVVPDGREMKFTCFGEEFAVPGNGSQTQVSIERRGTSVQFGYQIDTMPPTTKLVTLAPPKQGTSLVEVRLNGMPKLTEGALFSAAVVRGPVQLVPPKPE
jgi:hypothetical protein